MDRVGGVGIGVVGGVDGGGGDGGGGARQWLRSHVTGHRTGAVLFSLGRPLGQYCSRAARGV